MKLIARVLTCFAIALVAAPAFAQDAGKVAVVATSASSVGVLLNTGERFALRPEISFSRNTSEQTSSATTTESSSWSLGAGASVLFYMGGTDNLRPYLAPRFSVTRTKSSSQSDANNQYSASGSVGAQYALGQRFSLFGEVGLNFGYQKTTFTSSVSSATSTTTSKAIGTRSLVGVGIYF